MDTRKVRQFKNRQKRLAKKIAEAHSLSSFTIDYVQQMPSVYRDRETLKKIIGNNSQIVFPTLDICKGKHRVIVVMSFKGDCEKTVISKILRRQFSIMSNASGFEVRTSVNPHTIPKL